MLRALPPKEGGGCAAGVSLELREPKPLGAGAAERAGIASVRLSVAVAADRRGGVEKAQLDEPPNVRAPNALPEGRADTERDGPAPPRPAA